MPALRVQIPQVLEMLDGAPNLASAFRQGFYTLRWYVFTRWAIRSVRKHERQNGVLSRNVISWITDAGVDKMHTSSIGRSETARSKPRRRSQTEFLTE